MWFVPGVISVLSVGKVAGPGSPALLDRFVVSINRGANLRLGFVDIWSSSGGGLRGDGSGVSSGVGFTSDDRLLLTDVSTSCGANRRLLGGSGCAIVPDCFSSSFILTLLIEVSTGSTGKRRWLFVVVSTGWGRNRRGGGSVSVMSL